MWNVDIEHYKVTFSELFNEYKNEELLLMPSYQRDYVWSDGQKDKLIDSIRINLPIHDIVFAEFPYKIKNYREVIDGKHRLKCIFEKMSENNEFYKEFRLRALNITNVKNPTELQIKEIYNRLNYGGANHDQHCEPTHWRDIDFPNDKKETTRHVYRPIEGSDDMKKLFEIEDMSQSIKNRAKILEKYGITRNE